MDPYEPTGELGRDRLGFAIVAVSFLMMAGLALVLFAFSSIH